ncbi:MAG: hypothetical protein WA064_05445 [Candidatus Moraniibacteriota bacterium]
MRMWISGFTLKFQPDTDEEEKALDIVLGENTGVALPIGDSRGKKLGEGAKVMGMMGGHETERWIHIDAHKAVLQAFPQNPDFRQNKRTMRWTDDTPYEQRQVYAAISNVPETTCIMCTYFMPTIGGGVNTYGQPGACCCCRAEAHYHKMTGRPFCF